MRFDPGTLVLCHLLLIAFTAGAMAFYGRRQRTFDGYWHFVAGTVTVAAGFLFYVARARAEFVDASILGANLLFTLGAALRYDGTRRFLAGSAASPAVHAFPAACLAWSAWFRFGVDRFDLRTLGLGAAIFPLAIGAALLHLRAARVSRPAIHRVMAFSFAATGILLLGNGIATVAAAHTPMIPPLGMPFLEFLLMLDAVVALGVVILNAARLEEEQERVRARLVEALADAERAAAEVRNLEGLLPLCPACRRVRDDAGYWMRLERYVADRTGGRFSHGFCPDCAPRARR